MVKKTREGEEKLKGKSEWDRCWESCGARLPHARTSLSSLPKKLVIMTNNRGTSGEGGSRQSL